MAKTKVFTDRARLEVLKIAAQARLEQFQDEQWQTWLKIKVRRDARRESKAKGSWDSEPMGR